jgi:transcriptional regulator with XRE-family HTH domain
MGLGERIAEAIAGSGKSKAQIARECEVTAGAVSQWLSGATGSLKAETALALEQATGFRAYWILHGKGARKAADAVHVWPFPKVPLERFERLEDDDKGYVQRRLLQAIEECEHSSGPMHPVPQSRDVGDELPETQLRTRTLPKPRYKRRG